MPLRLLKNLCFVILLRSMILRFPTPGKFAGRAQIDTSR
jgi:hypothetical protein